MMITHRIDIDLMISLVTSKIRLLACFKFSHQVLEAEVKYYIAQISSKSSKLYKEEHQVHVCGTKKGRISSS